MKRLLLVGLFFLGELMGWAGEKPPKPRISVTFDSTENHTMANARTAVVGTPFVLDFFFMGVFEGDAPLVVTIEVEGEMIAATRLNTEMRLLHFRYTFGQDDYFAATLRRGPEAEFAGPPAGDPNFRDEVPDSGQSAELGIKVSVVRLVFDKKGRHSKGKIVVSLTYKVVLICLSCTA